MRYWCVMSSLNLTTARRAVRNRDAARLARTSEDGAAAVEFALILPVLAVLLAGIIEASLLLYTWGNMEFASRQAARAVAIGEITKDQAEDFVEKQLSASPGRPVANATVTLNNGATALENEVVVQVSIPGTELTGILPFGLLRFVNLSTTVKLHRET